MSIVEHLHKSDRTHRDCVRKLQDEISALWDERADLIKRLSRMEYYATQRREAMRRFVDLINDGHFDGSPALKETAMFALFERQLMAWEERDREVDWLGREQ